MRNPNREFATSDKLSRTEPATPPLAMPLRYVSTILLSLCCLPFADLTIVHRSASRSYRPLCCYRCSPLDISRSSTRRHTHPRPRTPTYPRQPPQLHASVPRVLHNPSLQCRYRPPSLATPTLGYTELKGWRSPQALEYTSMRSPPTSTISTMTRSPLRSFKPRFSQVETPDRLRLQSPTTPLPAPHNTTIITSDPLSAPSDESVSTMATTTSSPIPTALHAHPAPDPALPVKAETRPAHLVPQGKSCLPSTGPLIHTLPVTALARSSRRREHEPFRRMLTFACCHLPCALVVVLFIGSASFTCCPLILRHVLLLYNHAAFVSLYLLHRPVRSFCMTALPDRPLQRPVPLPHPFCLLFPHVPILVLYDAAPSPTPLHHNILFDDHRVRSRKSITSTCLALNAPRPHARPPRSPSSRDER